MARAVRRRTAGSRDRELHVPGVARLDLERERRTGVPEVILAEGKSPGQLAKILRELHRARLGAIVSRLAPGQVRGLRSAVRSGLPLRFKAGGRMAILRGATPPPVAGVVAVVTAGTADIEVAREAEHLLAALGVRVVREYDVGVAGLHRLVRAVERTERHRPSVYLAFAGREGALPTVLAGLVRAPVVGVPVSTGYGRGGRGEAALSAMLQSCAPVAVVNIDGAVPAALFAVQLLRGTRRGERPPSAHP